MVRRMALRSMSEFSISSRAVWVVFPALSLISPQIAAAENDPPPKTWSVTYENDVFAGEDQGYTNGIAGGYSRGDFDSFTENNSPGWMRWLAWPLPFIHKEGLRHSISYVVGQTMQTPEDLEDEKLIEDDLPYAGLLFWHGRMHSFDRRTAHEIGLKLGAVGPASGAEQVQTAVHDLIGATEPEGWDNQLENEPVLNLRYIHRWRALVGDLGGIEVDVVPALRLQAGNLISDVGLGFSARVGKGLEASYPTASILSGRDPDTLVRDSAGSWYLSVGLIGGYVFNDLLVEGNTWRDSHGLEIKNGRYSYGISAAYTFRNWQLKWSFVSMSEVAEILDGSQEFGAVSVAWNF